jgi:hypothetical protein
MKDNTIVQFVCFQTEIETDTFFASWEQYAKSLGKDLEVILHESQSQKNRFQFVSRHTSAQEDFRFVFVKGRRPEHFGEHHVRVVQAGGYHPLQIECGREANPDETKILVFLLRENTLPAYKELKGDHRLNIYEAYYESSSYPYILEFFVPDRSLADFLRYLKQSDLDHDMGVYKERELQFV